MKNKMIFVRQRDRARRVDRILTRPEAAKFLKISVRTLDEWRRAKLLPAIILGRTVRFSMGGLQKVLAKATVN
jgi:excisionase family DNA binding protein